MQPSITVLMTVYNGGDFLKSSIESVLNQTCKDFEFLIINDCSTDETMETINSYHDPRIVVHTNHRNIGQTASLNVGLRLARGDYIARIDADDFAFPQWLERQVDAITRHPDHSVISANAVVVDEYDKCQKVSFTPMALDDIIIRSLIRSPVNHVGSVMKKKDVLEAGGYDQQFRIAADYGLWVKLLINNAKMTTTPELLMSIRTHSQSVTQLGRGSKDVPEIENIMKMGIRHFSINDFTDEEIHLLCKSVYDEGNLTDTEFDQAIGVLKKVYEGFKPAFGMSPIKLAGWSQHQCRVLYLKRIHYDILRGQVRNVRGLSKKAIRDFGNLSIFSAFLILSCLGKGPLRLIPGTYFYFQRSKAFWSQCKKSLSPNVQ